MNKSDAERIAKTLAAAQKAMSDAFSSTQDFSNTIQPGSALPKNMLQLLAAFVSDYEEALRLTNEFAAKLDAIKTSVLNTAAIVTKVQDAEKQALMVSQTAQATNVTDAAARIKAIQDAVEKLLVLNGAAADALKDAAAAYETLRAKHPDFKSDGSDDSENGVWWDRAGSAFSGFVILGVCIALLVWLTRSISDKSLLDELAHIESARGLLTLLIVGTTAFVGMVIVLGMWLGDGDNESEQKFLRSKEVFSILMTASGTILGFYYGSDKGAAAEPKFALTSLKIERPTTNSASVFGSISGGKEPYHYAIRPADTNLAVTNLVAEGGAISYSWTNLGTNISAIPITVFVTDAATNQIEKTGEIPTFKKEVKP